MATPKQVGKRSWNDAMATVYRRLSSARRECAKAVCTLSERPIPSTLTAVLIGHAINEIGEVSDALRRLEGIIDEDPRLREGD